VTVDEAARHLGLTVDAVRKRVQRGQIAYEKDEAGRVRIILDEGRPYRTKVRTLQDRSQALMTIW
jgi:excisionase family DNA binding protein